jgi:hypothetical protein
MSSIITSTEEAKILPIKLTHLFVLSDSNGQIIFSVKADGTVEINPKYSAQQAANEFWKWIVNYNLVQPAVEQAKNDERNSIINKIEEQKAQWNGMRPMATAAAQELIDLIRK